MKKFGTLVKLTKKQMPSRKYFSKMPVGTLAVILEEVDLPTYDALAVFEFEPRRIEGTDGREYETHTGYLERDTYEFI